MTTLYFIAGLLSGVLLSVLCGMLAVIYRMGKAERDERRRLRVFEKFFERMEQ